ncbi:hypothetical protein BCR43DRAFT_482093 [Syncephalastrum racemosum]|uniref:RING-type domain-containing protein n=1 Tax=Syncephalastrum racemosum TaxID=13706 RepID=A0A1X2HT34_SYNRA|nr:hypothetical protein BCR43DRAFT_482093 [Syncephalastrum racemosum]
MPKTRDSRGSLSGRFLRQDGTGADVDVDWHDSTRRSPEEQQVQEEQTIAWSSDDDNEHESYDIPCPPKVKDKDKGEDKASFPACSIPRKLLALQDPPVCFCGKQAYRTQDVILGTVYDCHYTDNAAFPRGVRCSGMICGFHIHKEVYDQFRRQLQQGKDIDKQDPELTVCPYFNFTACALLGMTNTYAKRTPPVTKCFCGLPMVLSEPDNFSATLTFRCPNAKTPGARPKCSYKVRAEQVPFHRISHLPHSYYADYSQEGISHGTPPCSLTDHLPDLPLSNIPDSSETCQASRNRNAGSHETSSHPPTAISLASSSASSSSAVAVSSSSFSSSFPAPSSSPASIIPLPLPPPPRSPTSQPDTFRKQPVPTDSGSSQEDDMLDYPHTRQTLADMENHADIHKQFEGASDSLLKRLQDVQFEMEAVARRTHDMIKRSAAVGETDSDFRRLQLQVARQKTRLQEQETRTQRAEAAARTVQNEHDHMIRLLQTENERRRTVQRDIVQLEVQMASSVQERQQFRNLIQERRHRRRSGFDIKCCVCQHRTIEFAILPCFHSCYCHDCVSKLQECAICRGHILGLQRIYYD